MGADLRLEGIGYREIGGGGGSGDVDKSGGIGGEGLDGVLAGIGEGQGGVSNEDRGLAEQICNRKEYQGQAGIHRAS